MHELATAAAVIALAAWAAQPASPGAAAARPETARAHVPDDGESVPLDAVPAAVRQAALDAVPGLVLERASRESEDGVVVYELEGNADGQRVEVEVTATGEILEVEREPGGAEL